MYYPIKIFHILSAALLIASMMYCYYCWRRIFTSDGSYHIQKQTWLVIVPVALILLVSGFTMISLQHYDLSAIWIRGSILGFLILMSSWFAFMYLLLSPEVWRQSQFFLLWICLLTLLGMIFFMVNKI